MDAYHGGIRSTIYQNVKTLCRMCDEYYDPHYCEDGGTRTCFEVKGWGVTDDMSNQCLKLYNQKNSKNFILVEVVKLNVLPSYYYCMTFSARDAESEGIQYFRGVVYVSPATEDVLLCQIKDDGGVTIPPEHDESYNPLAAFRNITCPTDFDDYLLSIGSVDVDRGSDAGLGNGLAVGSVDSDVGSADVDRDSDTGFGDGLAVGSVDVNSSSDVGSIGVHSAP